MKIPDALSYLDAIASSRENPEWWLRNAYLLHGVWKVDVKEAVLAMDSQCQAQEKFMLECTGTKKGWQELSGLDLVLTLCKDHPSNLFTSILANPSIVKQVEAMGSNAIERLADRVTKAQKIAKKARAKIPRTWRTSAIFLWTNTWESRLPTPPMCLLSDTAISELFSTDNDFPSGESIRQEINRGLNLYRPTTPRYGIERRRDQVKFVLEHSGKVAVTRKL